MSVETHIQELKKKHEAISGAVENLQRAPASDDLEVIQLKKQKLNIKEEISRLSDI